MASAAYEYMFLIGFPLNSSARILFKKLRMENLSNDRGFIDGEPFFCFLEPEKYARGKVSKNFIGESRNRIGLMDIEWDSETPCSDPYCHGARSSLGEYKLRLLFF